ncbi:hypothetical protein ES703_34900 [subsurface metagenome]
MTIAQVATLTVAAQVVPIVMPKIAVLAMTTITILVQVPVVKLTLLIIPVLA